MNQPLAFSIPEEPGTPTADHALSASVVNDMTVLVMSMEDPSAGPNSPSTLSFTFVCFEKDKGLDEVVAGFKAAVLEMSEAIETGSIGFAEETFNFVEFLAKRGYYHVPRSILLSVTAE